MTKGGGKSVNVANHATPPTKTLPVPTISPATPTGSGEMAGGCGTDKQLLIVNQRERTTDNYEYN
ncbi:MAG: hypothetical protein COA36_06230 [Desulfotalea sp.]|nr:MAG: hypothetical protein COA36_06230 [Desulfotalea sp.]